MPRALLIAEKPSLMREIQSVYNKHKDEIPYEIDFDAQRGHLLTLKLPNEIDSKLDEYSWNTLPFFPEDHGGWQYKIIKEKRSGNFMTASERYANLRAAIRTEPYDFIIHAGDPDQEGELLVNMVLNHIGTDLPVKRFWTNDLTENHILHALTHLRDDRRDPALVNLLAAAYVRQHADYLFGMNISRGASLQMRGRVACGRVKTFIQSCVVKREEAIENFTPSTVYGVRSNYAEGFSGTLFSGASVKTHEDADEDQKQGIVWFKTADEAQQIINKLDKKATVLTNTSTHTKTTAPKLFKLSSLQVAAGKNGMTPNDVLEAAQSLYEKKIMSYPRTACEYIGSEEDFKGILNALEVIPELKPFIDKISDDDIMRVKGTRKWINDAELEKQGHSALRPTTVEPDIDSLSDKEKTIFMMVARRFIAMFMPAWEQDNLEIITMNNGKSFKTTGKKTTARGYLDVLEIKAEDKELPNVCMGDELTVENSEIVEKTTQCPSHYTQADLIAVCENPIKYLDDPELKKLGKRLTIGTEATRANIINMLIERDKYLETFKQGKKEYVRATPIGTAIIHNLDGLIICKPDMTGEWEEMLESIRTGEKTSEEVEQQIKKDLVDMLYEIRDKEMVSIRQGSQLSELKCPKCGEYLRKFDWGYACSAHKREDPSSCPFVLSTNVLGAKLTEEDVKLLIEGKATEPKNLTSKKTNKKFTAALKLNEENNFEFVFPSNETEYLCPMCGRKIIKIGNNEHPGLGCMDKENCGFKIWTVVCGKKLSPGHIKELLTDRETTPISGFKSKKGTTFSAKLKLDKDGKVQFDFDFERVKKD